MYQGHKQAIQAGSPDPHVTHYHCITASPWLILTATWKVCSERLMEEEKAQAGFILGSAEYEGTSQKQPGAAVRPHSQGGQERQ